ncbi:MAG: hypothetical protein QXV69_00155 [Sulfolobaceae archaeon]
MIQVIVITSKEGEVLDFSPKTVNLKDVLHRGNLKEVYDDGELIRKLYVIVE